MKFAPSELRAISTATFSISSVARASGPMLARSAQARVPPSACCASRQAFAAFEDRDYIIPDDVKRAVLPVLRHRTFLLKPEAELEGF